MDCTLQNDYGKIYYAYNNIEIYINPLTDGSYDVYTKEDDDPWGVETVSASDAADYCSLFEWWLNPWAYSDFTYEPHLSDYYKASDTITFVATVLPIARIQLHFEDNKLLNFKYDFVDDSGASTGHFEATASNHGATTVTMPDTEEPPAVVPVSSLTLNKSSLTLEVGQSEQLTATVLPDDATDKTVVWKSSNGKVASVVDGLVVANSVGTAKITAVAGSITAVCNVQVSETVVPVSDPFAGVTLSYVANSFNGAIMDESYTANDIEEFASKITISYFDDGAENESGGISEGSFELYSSDAEGNIEYAFFGRFDSFAEGDPMSSSCTDAYYSGTTGKYYHNEHVAWNKEDTISDFGFVTYDRASGLYAIEAYIAKADSMGQEYVAKGQFSFEFANNTPLHLSGLPEDTHDDDYEAYIENSVYQLQSMEFDPEDFAEADIYASASAGMSISVFEDNYMELHRLGFVNAAGAVAQEHIVERGDYRIVAVEDDQYLIEFKAYDAVFGYDVLDDYGGSYVIAFDPSTQTLILEEEVNGSDEVEESAMCYYTFAKQEGVAPVEYDVPELPDNWNASLIATRISAMGSTASLPSLPGVKECNVTGIVDDVFTITAVMASRTRSSINAYNEFVQTMTSAEYGFTMAFEDGTLSYTSSDGKIVVRTDLVTTSTPFVVTITVTSNIPSYPGTSIDAWLEANNITDAIPQFMVDSASKYVFVDSPSVYLNVYLRSGVTASSIISKWSAILSRMGYSIRTVGSLTYYVSENSQIAFLLQSSSYDGSEIVVVGFLDPENIPEEQPAVVYPGADISVYLQGVTDGYPSFDLYGANQFAFAAPSDGAIFASLSIGFENGADVSGKAAMLTRSLASEADYGYSQKTFVIGETTYEGFYVSPNRQVGFKLQASENSLVIEMINFALHEGVAFPAPAPTLMSISANGYTAVYTVGDTFAFDGKIYALYSDGSTQELSVDDVTIGTPDMTVVGTNTVTITYAVDGSTYTCSITIKVEAAPEEKSIVFYCQNAYEWIVSKNAIFKIWAWGGEYGGGAWIDVDVEESGYFTAFSFDIYENVTGFKILRCKPETEFPDVWDASLDGYVLSETEDLFKIYGIENGSYFGFIGAPNQMGYTYICTNENWDIKADGAAFAIWAWGGEYGDGTWLDVDISGSQGNYYVVFTAWNNAAGFKLVRYNPDIELPENAFPDSGVWNESMNLLEIDVSRPGSIGTFVL